MNKHNKKDLGKKIKSARCSFDLTQQRLADMLGCTQGLVSAWENGKKEPTGTMLIRIIKILNLKF